MKDPFTKREVRKVILRFKSITGVEHEVFLPYDDFHVVPAPHDGIGYVYIMLIGKVGDMYRERYECTDYSVVRAIDVRVRESHIGD